MGIAYTVCCMVYWALCSPDRMNAAWDAGAWLGVYLVAVALAVLMMSVLYIYIYIYLFSIQGLWELAAHSWTEWVNGLLTLNILYRVS